MHNRVCTLAHKTATDLLALLDGDPEQLGVNVAPRLVNLAAGLVPSTALSGPVPALAFVRTLPPTRTPNPSSLWTRTFCESGRP